MGPRRWSLEAFFVVASCRVRISGLSCFIDILYGCLYLHTINLSCCMDIHSCYMVFFVSNKEVLVKSSR